MSAPRPADSLATSHADVVIMHQIRLLPLPIAEGAFARLLRWNGNLCLGFEEGDHHGEQDGQGN